MALIVESGAGLPDAESYASTSYADTYHADRGNDAWAALTAAKKEAALRLATEWLGQQYSGNWRGCRVKATQALDWPRSDVCIDGVTLDYTKIPQILARATCELALRASATSLTKDEGPQVQSVTVGPIERVFADGARQQTRFAAVENLIRPLLKSSGGIKLVRA